MDQEVANSNAPEAERRALECEGEQERIEAKLLPVEELISWMRSIGITQTTAGFLSWAGYIVMVGTAYALSQILLPRQIPGTDPISGALRGIAARIGEIHRLSDLWIPLLHFSGLLILSMLIILLSTALVRACTPWIYPKWIASRGVAGPKPAPLAFLNFMFGGQPRLTSSRRSRHQASDEEDKRHWNSYPHLIASLPFILSAALLLFLINGLGLKDAAAQFPTPYICVALVLGTVSASILYATFVLAPRMRAGMKTGALQSMPSSIRVELISLFAVLATTISGCAILPNRIHDALCWAGVSAFLLLASLPFACGIMQKGIFRDYLELEERRNYFRIQASTYRARPMMRSASSLDNDRGHNSFDIEFMDKLRELRVLDEIRRKYQPDFADAQAYQKFNDDIVRFLGIDFQLPPIASSLEPEAILAVVPVADDFVQRFGELHMKQAATKAALSTVVEELGRLEVEIAALDRREQELRQKRFETSRRALELRRAYSERQRNLRFEVEWIKSEFREAYEVGKSLRNCEQDRKPADFITQKEEFYGS
jgi:hypothetical protein